MFAAFPLLALSYVLHPVAPQGWKQVQPKSIPKELTRGYEHAIRISGGEVQRIAVGWQSSEYARRESGRRVLGVECKNRKTGEVYLIVIAERSDDVPQLALNRALSMGVVPQPRTQPHGVNCFGRWAHFDFGVIGYYRAEDLIDRLESKPPGSF